MLVTKVIGINKQHKLSLLLFLVGLPSLLQNENICVEFSKKSENVKHRHTYV